MWVGNRNGCGADRIVSVRLGGEGIVGDSMGPLGIGLGVTRARVRKLPCFRHNREFCLGLGTHKTLLRYFSLINLPIGVTCGENKVPIG